MKSIVVTLVFILFSFISIGQNLKALDDKYGFRDAKFEMPVSTFRNIVKESSVTEYFPNCELYSVTNVDLHIGEYILDDIVYWFYKGKLMTIEIGVSKGYLNQQGVLKVLETAYGKGVVRKSSFGSNSYTWKGVKVEMTYTMGDDIDPTGDIQIDCLKLKYLQMEDNRLLDKQKEQKILDAAKKL